MARKTPHKREKKVFTYKHFQATNDSVSQKPTVTMRRAVSHTARLQEAQEAQKAPQPVAPTEAPQNPTTQAIEPKEQKKNFWSFLRRTKLKDIKESVALSGRPWRPYFIIAVGLFALAISYKCVILQECTSSPSLSTPIQEEDENWTPPEQKDGFSLSIQTADLSIEAPVVEGTRLRDFELGIGHHVETKFPGEGGNVVLSGHRWYPGDNPYYTVFNDLDKLAIGDTVTVTYAGAEYSYRVAQQKTISPRDVSILEETNEEQLVLYTCTPRYTTARRLVYIAKPL